MSAKQHLIKAGLWQSLNMGAFALIQLGFYGYMARVLPKSDFGIIALANVFIVFAMTLADMGLGSALIQKKNLNRGHLTAAFASNVILALFCFLLVSLLVDTVSSFFDAKALSEILPILSLNFVIQAFGSVSNSLLQKQLRFKEIFIAESGGSALGSLFGIYLVSSNLGVWSLVYASLMITLLKSLGYIFFNRRDAVVFSRFNYNHVKELFHFGVGMSLIKLNNFVVNSGFIFILGKMIPLSSLGMFERSFRIMNLPGHYLGQVVDKIMFPGMAAVNDSNKKLIEYFKQGLALVNNIMIPFTALLILYTNEIVLILLGDKWLDAVLPLRILFIAIPFKISVRMCDSIIRAKGAVYRSANRKFLYSFVLVVCVLIGSITGGVIGVAIGVTFAACFNYFNMLQLVRSIFSLNISVFWRPFFESSTLTIGVILPITALYICLDRLLSLPFGAFIASLLSLLVYLVYIYRFKCNWFGKGINSLFDHFKLPYRSGSSNI